jgi:hypothetical protein
MSIFTSEAQSGKEVVTELEQHGFFRLMDASEVEAAKNNLIELYHRLKVFDGTLKDDVLEYTDNRFYAIDAEELFEIGGLEIYLKLAKTSFDKLNLKLEFANEQSIDTYEGKGWYHSIDINGKTYVAFDGKFGYKSWERAYINFIVMLNDQLRLQGSKEQFYPIICDNDGRMVLLTKKLFEIVQKYYPKDNQHPMELEQWKQLRKL